MRHQSRGVDLPRRADRPEHPRVVHEDVDGTELPPQVRERPRQPRLVGHVGHGRHRGPAGGLDQRHGLGQLVAGAGDDADGRAGAGQGPGEHAADAAAAAGDDRHGGSQLGGGEPVEPEAVAGVDPGQEAGGEGSVRVVHVGSSSGRATRVRRAGLTTECGSGRLTS